MGHVEDCDGEGMGCCHALKSEFQVKNFALGYCFPGRFAMAKCGPGVWYLIWRLVWAIYLLSSIGLTIYLSQFFLSRPENLVKWLVFMTNWANMLLALFGLMDCVVSFHMYFNRKDLLEGGKGTMPWYCMVLWVLANIANNMGVTVSLVYWVALHDYSRVLTGVNILPFISHGMNIIYIFLNCAVTAMPVRILHFYQGSGVLTIYMIFNAAYVLPGGTNDLDEPYVYGLLDWNKNPGLAVGIAIGGVFGTAIVAHGIMYLMHKLKACIFRCCISERVSPN